MRRVITTAILVLAASSAFGCTVCNSDIGIAVRAGIFNDSFPLTFLKVFAVLPVLSLALYVTDRVLPD